MKAQSGFTLVEALTAGTISAFVGLGLIATLNISNSSIVDSTQTLLLSQDQDVASMQMRISARKAFGAKVAGDPAGPFLHPAADGAFTLQKSITFCDSMGDTLSGYSLDQTTNALMEWKPGPSGNGYYPFLIGADTVHADWQLSNFGVLPRRKGVTFRLYYYRTYAGKSYTFSLIAETVQCRNNML